MTEKHPILKLLRPTESDKVAFLQSRGYVVELVQIPMSWASYHNASNPPTVGVWGVFRGNAEYKKPTSYNFGALDWLDDVCEEEYRSRLLHLLS